MKKLGNLLVQYEFISSEQLQKALDLQRQTGLRIGDQLKAMGVISQDQINWIVTKQYNIPYILLTPDIIDPQVFHSFPYPVLLNNGIVPVRMEEGKYYFALSDPSDQEAVEVISRITKKRYSLVLAEYEAIQKILEDFFSFFPYPIHTVNGPKEYDSEQAALLSTPKEIFSFLSGFMSSYHQDEFAVFPEDYTLVATSMNDKERFFRFPLPAGWENMMNTMLLDDIQPFFHVDDNILYVSYFYSLRNQAGRGLLMKKEPVELFDREVFKQYSADLYNTLASSTSPSFLVFSLSFMNSLASFHIMYRMFFQRSVIFNHLQYRPLSIPYLFPEGSVSSAFQYFSVFTDNIIEAEKYVSARKGNVFFIDHDKRFDPASISEPVLHVSDKETGSIIIELLQ